MADSSPPPLPTAQPAVVKTAITMLYWSIAANVAWLLFNWVFLGKFRTGTTLFDLLVGNGIWAWLVYKMDERRNWARITFLIFFVLGILLLELLLDSSRMFAHSSYVAGIYQHRLEVSAVGHASLIMLFSRAAGSWFGHVEPPPAIATSLGKPCSIRGFQKRLVEWSRAKPLVLRRSLGSVTRDEFRWGRRCRPSIHFLFFRRLVCPERVYLLRRTRSLLRGFHTISAFSRSAAGQGKTRVSGEAW